MSTSYVYFIIFFCVAYLIITDQSVARGFYMLTRLVKFNYEKIKWWLLNDPGNPIIKYLIWRRSMKLAKELQKELNNK